MTDLPAQPSKSRVGVGLAAGGAVLAVAAIGGGVWGYNAFFGQGDQPAQALPTKGLLGYVALDMSPNGEQLLAARGTLKKFPGIADQIKLDGKDDLRKELFAKLQESGTCKDIDWDKQVAPWLGDRVGVGVMDGGSGKEPEALLVLQTTDADAATKNVDATLTCLNEDSPSGEKLESHAFVGDWLVLGQGDLADGIAKKVEAGSLADDENFQKWTDAAGDPGIATGYASPLAIKRFVEFFEKEGGQEMPECATTDLDDFTGGAGVVRFAHGGLETEFATALPKGAKPTSVGSFVEGLPASTVGAAGFVVSPETSDCLVSAFLESFSAEIGMSKLQGAAMIESMTGLSVPDDVTTLLGEQAAFVVDSGVTMDHVDQNDLDGARFGFKIKGDTDEIETVLAKIKKRLGAFGAELHTRSEDGAVVVTLSGDYVDTLATKGGLGDNKTFRKIVPEASKASSVFFVDFDAKDWLDDLLKDADAPKDVRDNVEPLRGLGISGWVDGDESHSRMLLTTD